MKNISLLIFAVLIIMSCKSKQNIVSFDNNENDKNSPFITEYNKEFVSGETFHLSVMNNSEDTLTILSPSVAYIQMYENQNWRRVKIQYCPCGANCINPPRKINLINGQSHNYSWNLKESWCGEKMENGIPETIITGPKVGTYRIKIDYIYKNKKNEIIKTFKIISNN